MDGKRCNGTIMSFSLSLLFIEWATIILSENIYFESSKLMKK